ncbi:universal stress protein [Mycobacterium sp. MBM]|nr:universal stress protein [Mycobacterium sp. MBM]
MSSTQPQYGILVAVDGSPESDTAISWAAREAAIRKTHVTLLHVNAPILVTWPISTAETAIAEWQNDSSRQILDRAEKIFHATAAASGTVDVHAESVAAPIVPSLVEATKSALMVVVGNRGTGSRERLALGSVTAGLLHHAHCPVVVVHTRDAADSAGPVVLGIDGSPASEAATRFAFEEASLRGADLVAMHAWSDVTVFPAIEMDWHLYQDEAKEILAERLAGWQEQFPDVHVQRRLPCDRPAHWLVTESEHAQLVVVGSRGRGGFAGLLLGSVSSAVARKSDAPVVVVRD